MKLVYVIGNEELASERILNRLGKQNLVRLGDYRTRDGELPVMLSTSGVFHGDSYTLSSRIIEKDRGLMKVLYDGHADFGLETDEEAIRKILEENEISISNLATARNFDTHMRDLVERLEIRNFAILRLNNQKQIEEVKAHYPGGNIPGSSIVSRDVMEVERFGPQYGEWNMHVTVDLDVIKDAPFVRPEWRTSSKESPDFKTLIKSIRLLLARSNLMGYNVRGFDLIGFHPKTEDFSEKIDQVGLDYCHEIIKIIEEHSKDQ